MYPRMVYHQDGRAEVVDSQRAYEDLGEGWQDEPTHAYLFPGERPPEGGDEAGATAARPPAPEGDPDELARVRAILPPQSALHAMNVEQATTLVADNENKLVVKQVLIDEIDNPDYPGGRKTIVEACLKRLREFPPAAGNPSDKEPAATAEGQTGE